MKKIIRPIICLTIIIIGCTSTKPVDGKLRECPEEYFEDRMPQIIDPKNPDRTPRAYFIYKGRRHELSEFDTAWVFKNCDVEKQVLY